MHTHIVVLNILYILLTYTIQNILRISVFSLEKAMAPHSSILAWKIPWMEEPSRLQSMGLLWVRCDWATSLSLSCIGEGNGNPLQYSCLENPRDGGAWWAAVYGVRTELDTTEATWQQQQHWFSDKRLNQLNYLQVYQANLWFIWNSNTKI